MGNLFIIEHIDRIIVSVLIVLSGIGLLFIILKAIKHHVSKLKNRGSKAKILWKIILPLLFLILALTLKLNLPILVNDPELQGSLNQFLIILLIIAGAWILINSIRITRIIILSGYDIGQKDNLIARKMHTQLKILERVIVFIIIFVAFSIALMSFESIRRIGVSLFASAGVAGIILGLAAQRVIGSILAGMQLAITQPIRIDDVVIVEGEWGWIEEITLTYVVIRLWDRRRLVVPTTYFIEKPFQNWTRKSSDILGSVFIFTDYSMPVGDLREVFFKILGKTELWDGDIANVQVTNSTNQALEIRFLMSAVDSPTLWDLRVFVREKLVEYLQRHHPEKLPKTRVFINNQDN
jgi:small-conductance mechanosensitive channel